MGTITQVFVMQCVVCTLLFVFKNMTYVQYVKTHSQTELRGSTTCFIVSLLKCALHHNEKQAKLYSTTIKIYQLSYLKCCKI
jgi:hypothetical protein